MKIAVVGLWHLGLVTAACLTKSGHTVCAYDPDIARIDQLVLGVTPVYEPMLDTLLEAGLHSQRLAFTADATKIADAEVVWVTFDTPVRDDDTADVESVLSQCEVIFPYIKDNALVLVSSQLPIGSIHKMHARFKERYPAKSVAFACSPENLRLGQAINIFLNPDRVVIGLDNVDDKARIKILFSPITDKLIWMSVVSAEMTKHAINGFLAMSVTFINELAVLCEATGASARDVEIALKSEERIGPKAYVRPGDAIAGGTLLRDIHYLEEVGKAQQRNTHLISAVGKSNLYHKQWSQRKLVELLNDLDGKKIAMLGLTYKVGTDTLRRSAAIDTCVWLSSQGAHISAFDPSLTCLPESFAEFIQLQTNIEDALTAADAVIIATPYPQFKTISANDFVAQLKQPFVLDPSGFIAKNISTDSRLNYFSVGMPS